MSSPPRDTRLDSTTAFLSEGYRFISNRCTRLGSDVFETRLLLQKTICMRGAEAARLFYDNARFRRRSAMPVRAQKTLLGVGGVQSLDGQRHRERKALFMSLMTPERVAALTELFRREWLRQVEVWQQRDRVSLFDEAQLVLCRAVCRWAGMPINDADAPELTRLLGIMIDSSGGIGLRYWHGRLARRIVERRIGALIEQLRKGTRQAPEGSALYAMAFHRESDPRTGQGRLLAKRVAAVELINILRPTVAIARYIVFAATALHEHAHCRDRIAANEPDYLQWFVQEVRRFYPFFPAVAARVCRSFDWRGMHFPRGRRVLLDLYGTNHDPKQWEAPEYFAPERFRDWQGDAFDFIAQGGGDHHVHHRCPGEWITIELTKAAVQCLVGRMQYDVPPQDLSISLRRMPTLPRSRFVMEQVQAVQPATGEQAGAFRARRSRSGF